MAFPVKDRVVVLTGAASGIGEALAEQLAAREAKLALIDVNASGLEMVATKARTAGAIVRTFVIDLAKAGAAVGLAEQVATELGPAAVLINNAGIALGGSFEMASAAQFDLVMAINFAAQVALVREFLPQLKANGPAQIVNLSSLFGIVGVPGNVAYCASKFAVRGFSEALRTELTRTDVGITVVHPGGVRTNIARSAVIAEGLDPKLAEAGKARMEKVLKMSPESAASRILKALDRREKRVLVGNDAKALAFVQWLLPVSYGRLMPRS